jgi:aminobenzoyl-glutamate transport protein
LTQQINSKGRGGIIDRLIKKALDWVEVIGNKLPQPVTLFFILMLIVLATSWVASVLEISAVHPGTKETIYPVNLISGEGVKMIFTRMVKTFADFPPLGLVLSVMLGIGVAERSGLIVAALKAFVASVPRKLITISIITAGMLCSVASDAGYVVLIPLGAVIFLGMGRHPIAGLAAAFAGVSGGFGANIFLTSLDPLLAAFTQSAAQLIDPTYLVEPTANWYFMAASVPIIAIAGTFVTEKIIEPRLGPYTGTPEFTTDSNPLTREEKKGLVLAVLAALITGGVLAFLAVNYLRTEDGAYTPLFQSIVAIMLVIFFVPGLVYGISVGKIKGDRDVAKMLADSMAVMGGYIVLAFAAAQFVAYFSWSNIGVIFAISGAGLLESIHFTGIPLIVMFVIVASLINILIGSASAKWAIMAPVFVPMLMLMGYSPEMTQAAYRIGDSYTNILTPLLPYFPLIITFAHRYDKKVGIGTLVSSMLPFAVVFAVVRIIMLVLWMLFEIPLGPDSPMTYVMPG